MSTLPLNKFTKEKGKERIMRSRMEFCLMKKEKERMLEEGKVDDERCNDRREGERIQRKTEGRSVTPVGASGRWIRELELRRTVPSTS